MDSVNEFLAALGLKLVNSVVAAVMSCVSLRFFDDLSMYQKWTTFLGGWALAAWGAAPLASQLEMKQGAEIGLVLLIAAFGMALVSEIIKLLRGTDWRGLVAAIIKRKSGTDDKGGSQ